MREIFTVLAAFFAAGSFCLMFTDVMEERGKEYIHPFVKGAMTASLTFLVTALILWALM